MVRPTADGVEGSQAHDAENDEAPGSGTRDSDPTTNRARSVTQQQSTAHDSRICATCRAGRVILPSERIALRSQRERIALRDAKRVIDLREP
jgi:hypothetical protein